MQSLKSAIFSHAYIMKIGGDVVAFDYFVALRFFVHSCLEN